MVSLQRKINKISYNRERKMRVKLLNVKLLTEKGEGSPLQLRELTGEAAVPKDMGC